MTKISKELIIKAGILPRLRLGTKLPGGGVVSNGKFVVKIVEDKLIRKMDATQGKEIEFVRYIVEHNGEKKAYDTKLKDKNGQLSYLVQRLAEFNEGDEITMEMKKQGVKNYVEVARVGETSSAEVEEEHEDIINID